MIVTRPEAIPASFASQLTKIACYARGLVPSTPGLGAHEMAGEGAERHGEA